MEDQFLPEEEQEEAKKLSNYLKFKEVPVKTDPSLLWRRIQGEIQGEGSVRPIDSRRRNLPYWLAAAAAVVFFLAFFFLWPNGEEYYQTPMAKTLELNLPDQSEVLVNANSELRVNNKGWSKNRRVSLKGEAFFKVEKGQPFSVQTMLGEVRVLGTAFNVFARDNNFTVSCAEGRVAVRNKAGKETILTAGEEARLIGENWSKLEVDSDQIAAWRKGLFIYSGEEIQFILEEIKRQYKVDVQIPQEIAEEKITMRFDKNQSLEESLEPILFTYRLTIKRNGRKVVLE